MEQTENRQNPKGLYSPRFEHDNCGIGAVVNINGIKSHDTVVNALTIVETLEHRAGKDAEGKTGDGVGILLQISHRFFKKVAALEPWYEVLRYDGSYRQAFLGISAGLLVQGDYEGSMKYAKLADSSYRYDRAFECWRQEWLTEHSRALALGALLLIAGGILLHRYWKKHRKGGMNR